MRRERQDDAADLEHDLVRRARATDVLVGVAGRGARAPAARAPGRSPRTRRSSGGLERRLLDRQAVGVGRDHPQLRAADAETRMPVRIGRVSSRDAERATRAIVSTNACAGQRDDGVPAGGSGNGGKSSARSVRMWNVAAPAVDLDVLLGRPQLERPRRRAACGRRRAAAGAGRTTMPSRSTWRLERNAQADLHVGGAQLDAGRRRRRAGRRTAPARRCASRRRG